MFRVAVNRRLSGLGDFVETLRANNKIPHVLILGVATVAGLAAAFWQVGSIGGDAIEYIETQGWTRAMERFDQITAQLWRRTDK
jgi:hypothetical protein